MALDFIKDDPVGQGFDAQWARDEKVRLAREAYGVDEAIRGGLGDVIAGQQQPRADAAPQYAALSGGPARSMISDAPPSASGGLGARIQAVEDPSGTAINQLGYTGRYQFGKAALQDIRHYTPAPGEDMTKNDVWSGQVTVPGHAPMTREQFAQNQPAQEAAFAARQTKLDQEIQTRGLTAYIGRNIRGVQITPDSIKALMWIGGPQGAEHFLKTGGQYDPADANGTTMSAYAQKVTGGAGATTGSPNPMLADATASGVALGGASGLPGQTGPNYNPILARLQNQPGGGKVALDLLNRQGRTDVAQGRRLDQYQKLAMIAMGKGDVPTARYYAQLGGLQLPDAVFQDAGMMKRTALGSLMAQRIYRTDAQAGQVFLQTYLRTGNADAAFAAAGVPRDNPSFSPVWVKGIENDLLYSFNRRDGTMTPTVNPAAPPPPTQPPAAAPPGPTQPAPPAAPAAPPPPPRLPGVQSTAPAATSPAVGQSSPTTFGYQTLATGAPPTAAPQPAPQSSIPAPPSPGVPGQISRPAQTSQGRPANAIVRQQMLINAGMPPAQAAAIAAGAAPTANGIITAMGSAARIVDPMGIMEPPERQAAIAKWMDDAFGPGWRDRLRGPSGAPATSSTPSGGAQPQYQPLNVSPAPGRTPPAAPQPAPPPGQRQRGATYQTPRGPMVWTGTGWVSPTE